LRVLVISAAYGPNSGGVATHVVNLVSGLVKWFDDTYVDVLTLRKSGMGYKKDPKGRLIEWKLERRTEPEFDGRRLVLGRLVRFAFENWHELSPDLIHVHDFDSLQVGLLLRTAHSIPLVMTVHRAPTEWFDRRYCQDEKDCFMEVARVHKFIDRIVVPSAASRKVLAGQGFRGVQVIPHGISQHLLDFETDPSVLSGLALPSDAELVFCPSRADEHKDLPLFIRGAARLRYEQPPRRVVFLIASEPEEGLTHPPELKELHLIAKAHNLTEGRDIFFTRPFAYGSPLATIYRRASVVVVPSLHESFGQTVLDAFMFGKPVVARASTGLTEIVQNLVNGLLFEKEKGLAFQMRLALTDKKLVAQIVENAKNGLAKRHSVERMARDYRRLYIEGYITT
jgi:sucrose-phosphate synthase